MTKYQSTVTIFKKLEYSQKKVRLLALCEILQNHSIVIRNILPRIQKDQVSEEDMIITYNNLAKAIENVEKKQLKQAISQIEEIQTKMEEIKRKEGEDKEDPELLLKDL